MNTPIVSWYKASDDTAATGLNVDVHSQWFRCGPRDRPSVHVVTPTSITCAYKVQFTNWDVSADVTATPKVGSIEAVSDFPSGAYTATPTQPAGSGASTMIAVDSLGEWFRIFSTASSGGTSTLPTTKISYTEKVED